MATAVFLDAGYLDKILYFDHRNARLDYQRLAQALADPDALFRAYYYHCMPYQGNPPTADERDRYSSKHRFMTALRNIPRFEVRLGRLAKVGRNEDGSPIFVQKRVDCMVGVDMALLAGKRTITTVALLSGDSDLIPAVEAVKQEGVIVTLWHGSDSRDSRPSHDLVQVCDERRELTPEIVARILRIR
jgi:uncharacterized LabA/DUF88 family protein